MANNNGNGKYLESWIWGAACSIHGAKDVLKYKDFIRPMILTKRLCDVFDDEVNRIAGEGGSRKKAFQLVKADHKLVRFFLPLLPEYPDESVWSIICKLSDRIGEQREFATCFKSLDQKVVVAGRKEAARLDLFFTFLHELMTGKTRMNQLILPTE